MAEKISTLRERLTELMAERGWRAVDLSARSGINKVNISYYLKGTTTPKGDNLKSIADAFNVSIEWLQGYDVGKNKLVTVPSGVLSPVPATKKIPRLGNVSCGTPIDSAENFDGYDDVPESTDCDYTLVAQGDSMIGARINDGDIVYIKKQSIVNNGEIAVVLVSGTETLLKRIYLSPTSVILQAENPAYPPLVFTGEAMNEISIIGKAVGFYSHLK